MRWRVQNGFSLIELIVTVTLIAIIAGLAVPLARNSIRRQQEVELRRALREMRVAIDRFKEASDLGLIEVTLGTEGYPEDLEILVEGVDQIGAVDRRLRFLRRILVDPMTNSTNGVCALTRTIRSPIHGEAKTSSTSIRDPMRWLSTAACTRSGKLNRTRGFTLLELMIVLTIIAILASIAVPMYQATILRAKEAVLKENLHSIRSVIDQYTADKRTAPQSLEDLIAAGYLREVPEDPITESPTTWQVEFGATAMVPDQLDTGIVDVRSGAPAPFDRGHAL